MAQQNLKLRDLGKRKIILTLTKKIVTIEKKPIILMYENRGEKSIN
jgi:hypothetical protein